MKKVIMNDNITIFQSELYKTNCTVIQTKDCIIVVDPTWLPNEVEEIQRFVYDIKENRPLYLIFTHRDWDHIIGYGAFQSTYTIGSEEMDNSTYKDEIIQQIHEFDHKYYLDRSYDITFPVLTYTIKQNEETLIMGDTKLVFYKAPGHTNDGIITVVEPLGVLIAGDYLSDVEFPYIYDNSLNYEGTLMKLDTIINNHKISLLVPGHGSCTNSLTEISARQHQSLEYIQRLRNDVTSGKSEEETYYLIENYKYPKGMIDFHKANYALIKNECNL